MCSAIFKLHTQEELAHGDIKPDNMVMTHDFKIALTDLGNSEPFYELVKKYHGTP